MMCESAKKRNDIEITAGILKMAVNGAKKSHIVYEVNLNFKILDKYLELLRKNDLINGPCENNAFTTTEKGLRYLDHFEDFQKYIKM